MEGLYLFDRRESFRRPIPSERKTYQGLKALIVFNPLRPD
jgi:hypothetical protein